MTNKKNTLLKKDENGAINVEITEGVERYDDVFYELEPKSLSRFKQKKQQYFFYTENGIMLRVQFLSDKIIRFNYALEVEGFEREFYY